MGLENLAESTHRAAHPLEGDGAAEVRRRLCLEPLLLKTRELLLRCGQLVAHVGELASESSGRGAQLRWRCLLG